MSKPLPSGRVAFYISPDNNEIYYSIVAVNGRYADGFEVLELPRGDPDSFYINQNLDKNAPNYRIVVEISKEQKALEKLDIQANGKAPKEALAEAGYEFERIESNEETGARELQEEQGFDAKEHPEMARTLIQMRPFPVNSTYGSKEEYRSFLLIDGDITKIDLQRTDKTETKSVLRLGAKYVEQGAWASLREIRENTRAFVELAEKDTTADADRLRGEAGYQKSITDWMEVAEAAIVATLLKQGTKVNTSSEQDPVEALRSTDAKVAALEISR